MPDGNNDYYLYKIWHDMKVTLRNAWLVNIETIDIEDIMLYE